MAELDYDELQRLADAATPGPWSWHSRQTVDGDSWAVFGTSDRALAGNRDGWTPDAEFIAASRSAVPALLARVRELEAERDAALSTIAKVRELHASFTDPDGTFCKVCEWVEYPCPTIRALGPVPSTGEGNE